jgi:hypothetical protein
MRAERPELTAVLDTKVIINATLLTNTLRGRVLHDLAAVAEWAPPAAFESVRPRTLCRAPDDDQFLHQALADRAAMNRPLRPATPRDFWP